MMKRLGLSILCVLLVLSLFSCGEKIPEACRSHKGALSCSKCGVVYFDSLATYIKTNANGKDGSVWAIVKEDGAVSIHLSYDEAATLITLSHMSSVMGISSVFLLKITPSLDGFDWAFSNGSKMIYGRLAPEEVSRKTLLLPWADCTYETTEFAEAQSASVSALVACMEYLNALLEEHPQHLTLANLGFAAYEG